MSTLSGPEKKCRAESARQAALERQVAGGHYLTKIQHVEFCQTNRIPWCESAAIKYLVRHRKKNGKEDIEKAIHYLELLIAIDYGRRTEEEDELDDLDPACFKIPIEEFLRENHVPEPEAEVVRIICRHQTHGDSSLMRGVKLLKGLLLDAYDEVPGMELL